VLHPPLLLQPLGFPVPQLVQLIKSIQINIIIQGTKTCRYFTALTAVQYIVTICALDNPKLSTKPFKHFAN
jgi:hypothetical protein